MARPQNNKRTRENETHPKESIAKKRNKSISRNAYCRAEVTGRVRQTEQAGILNLTESLDYTAKNTSLAFYHNGDMKMYWCFQSLKREAASLALVKPDAATVRQMFSIPQARAASNVSLESER